MVSGNMYADALMGLGQTGYTESAAPPPHFFSWKMDYTSERRRP